MSRRDLNPPNRVYGVARGDVCSKCSPVWHEIIGNRQYIIAIEEVAELMFTVVVKLLATPYRKIDNKLARFIRARRTSKFIDGQHGGEDLKPAIL